MFRNVHVLLLDLVGMMVVTVKGTPDKNPTIRFTIHLQANQAKGCSVLTGIHCMKMQC